jgi:hypothetical protein
MGTMGLADAFFFVVSAKPILAGFWLELRKDVFEAGAQ